MKWLARHQRLRPAEASSSQSTWSLLSATGLMSPLCPACLQAEPSADLCFTCERFLEVIENPCPNCATPMLDMGHCGQCLKRAPNWQAMQCRWHFSGLTRFLIHQFKYQRDFGAGECLLRRWLQAHANALRPDAIIPVPMHHKKQFDRGFNQAHWLAKGISKAWDVPLWAHVERTIQTEQLEGLSRKERQRVLKGVFKVTASPPKHVALVDDVFTSGATLSELSKTLSRAGVTFISVWTLARTPLDFK